MKKYESYKDSGIKWLGQIPSHWKIMRSKNMFQRVFRPVREDDDIITCFRDGQVTLRKNRRTEGFTESFKEIGYQGIRKGDLVIHQMDAFAGSIGVSDSDGKGTPVYICCVPKGPYNNYYYAFLLREMARTGYIKSLYRGIRERSSDFRFETFAVQSLAIPPIDEQNRIVEYLNSKTSEIDDQIASVEKEIELLKEYKQAEVARVVTHGLNPAVPMKSSGIEWIGDIPAHWVFLRNKNLFVPHYEAVGNRKDIPLLSLTTEGVILRDVESGKGKFPKDFDKYNVVYPDNIIFCLFDIDETPRTVGLCHNYGMITNAYSTFVITDKVLPRFINYFYMVVDNIKGLRPYYTGLRKVVQSNKFMQLKVPIPPIEEQQKIVDYIDSKTTEIDRLVVELTYQVEYLKEYKQRLVSDVVTGKINVQNN